MANQTDLHDFEDATPTDGPLPDGGEVVEKSDDAPHFDPDAETVTDAWEGTYLTTSWGYDQTNVNMAMIVEVSGTGKTVLAKLVRPETVDTGRTSEQLRPTSETFGESFRLHVREGYRGGPVFRGSYPYINGDPEEGTRKGGFDPWSNEPGASVRQTATNYGH